MWIFLIVVSIVLISFIISITLGDKIYRTFSAIKNKMTYAPNDDEKLKKDEETNNE